MKKAFYLDRANGKVMGVCAGISNHMGWDVTLVRVAMVVLILATFPWALFGYGAAAMIGKSRSAGDAPVKAARLSTYELNRSMRDIDRRMGEIDAYVASQDTRLAREIESLR